MTEQYRFPKWLFAEKRFAMEWTKERPHFQVTLTGKGSQAFTGCGDSLAHAAKNARKKRDETDKI